MIELFTKKGIGCIITNNPLSNIRVADLKDVNSIIKIIEPHEKSGALVKRSRELIEIEINKFFVYTYDNFVIGTGFLNFFTEKKKFMRRLAVSLSTMNIKKIISGNN